MALDTTAGGATSDAYIEITDGDDYFVGIDINKYQNWFGQDTNAQERAIRLATMLIDEYFVFMGKRATSTQRLEFPRKNVPRDGFDLDEPDSIPQGLSSIYDDNIWDNFVAFVQGTSTVEYLDDETIPEFLKNATAELALQCLLKEQEGEDIYAAPSKMLKSNVQSESIGGAISRSYFDPNTVVSLVEGIFKTSAYGKLTKYGRYKLPINTPGAGGQAVVA